MDHSDCAGLDAVLRQTQSLGAVSSATPHQCLPDGEGPYRVPTDREVLQSVRGGRVSGSGVSTRLRAFGDDTQVSAGGMGRAVWTGDCHARFCGSRRLTGLRPPDPGSWAGEHGDRGRGEVPASGVPQARQRWSNRWKAALNPFENTLSDESCHVQPITPLTFAVPSQEARVMEGVAVSIGSVGDAYDNALAESTIGLFTTEVVAKGNPFPPGHYKSVDDVEYARWTGSTGSIAVARTAVSDTSLRMISRRRITLICRTPQLEPSPT